jgi:hypothetical protein
MGKVGAIDNEHGYSVSGEIRLAHELSMAGIRAYDGGGCMYDPVLSGIRADGSQLHADKPADCASCPDYKYAKYTTPDYNLLHPFLPREAFVVASNGGSDYLYHPAHDPERVAQPCVSCRATRSTARSSSTNATATFPALCQLSIVHLENAEGAIRISSSATHTTNMRSCPGMPGIEFQGVAGHISRGMHGSFSPVDVHNTLPRSVRHFRETSPTPAERQRRRRTDVAKILGIDLPNADGRPLLEALQVQRVGAGRVLGNTEGHRSIATA